MDELVLRVDLLGSVLEALADAVVVADADGSVLLINDEVGRLTGYARDEVVGRGMDLLVPALGDDRGERLRLVANGHAIRLTDMLRRRDGVEVPVRVTLRRLVNGDGTEVLAVVRDAAPAPGDGVVHQLLAQERRRIADEVDQIIQRLYSIGLSVQDSAQRSRQPEVAQQLERDVATIGAAIRDLRASLVALGS